MTSRMVRLGDVELYVGVSGEGTDVLILSGGPGCVQYLERDGLSPRGHRCWFPEPRGVGRSGGGPHGMEQAVADLEGIRVAVGVTSWIVLGHSWGADLAVRYATDFPEAVAAVVGVAGRGPQRDRTWSEAYEVGMTREPVVDVDWVPEVHASLSESFTEWVHHCALWRRLGECQVPIHLVAAGEDIRPAWPLRQLAELLPHGELSIVPGVPHDFWFTHPEVWTDTVTAACVAVSPAAVDTSPTRPERRQ